MKKNRFVYPPMPEDKDFEDYPYDEPFNVASATDFTGLVPFINHDIHAESPRRGVRADETHRRVGGDKTL